MGKEVCGTGDSARVACEQKREATKGVSTSERVDELYGSPESVSVAFPL
jgi:hypothetical protein